MIKTPHWPQPIGYKPIDLQLERIAQALANLGNPQDMLPPVVHIAGTNGKGSTLAFMRAALEDAGYKVHIYTSPHLIEFNERIVLAGEKIDDDFLYEVLEECRQKVGDIKLTFFEATTAAAILAFAKVPADIVLLETGVGGRLDATNVIAKPLLTIISSITMDHQEYLGDTLTKIAAEKAAIIKPGVKCITINQEKAAAEVIRKEAGKKNSQLVIAPEDCECEISLVGKHQKQNAALAVTALNNLSGFKISEENIKSGLKKAYWPARMHHMTSGKLAEMLPDGCEIWVDGGHNESAAQQLVQNLKSWSDKKTYMIFGLLKQRDCSEILQIFKGSVIEKIVAVPIPDEEKSYSSEEISEAARALGFSTFAAKNLKDAIGHIMVQEKGALRIIVFGSLYLAGAVLAQNQQSV